MQHSRPTALASKCRQPSTLRSGPLRKQAPINKLLDPVGYFWNAKPSHVRKRRRTVRMTFLSLFRLLADTPCQISFQQALFQQEQLLWAPAMVPNEICLIAFPRLSFQESWANLNIADQLREELQGVPIDDRALWGAQLNHRSQQEQSWSK
mmetsp:Transcript_4042/g.8135  ORF Transcript_4042/g.8135 Transcript_4042/m.8135 type:complete len:151 (+) Transcript_4042:621-1073(+)